LFLLQIQGFAEEELPVIDSRLNSMTISDVSPKFALTRIIALYENQQFREASGFITRLNHGSFKAILTELPIDLFIDSMPQSLPIVESLYAKVFLSDGLNFTMKFLRPESVLMQMVKFFANRHDETNNPPGLKREMCGPFVSSCKKLLKVRVKHELLLFIYFFFPSLQRVISLSTTLIGSKLNR
jgi:hypothetical protein